MGNHTVGEAMGRAAEAALRNRQPGETALDILDRICGPYRDTDAEFEAVDPANPGWVHPHYRKYTHPHRDAALGMLILEAFAPNGLADRERFAPMIGEMPEGMGAEEGKALHAQAVDAWWDEVYDKFKQRYGFY